MYDVPKAFDGKHWVENVSDPMPPQYIGCGGFLGLISIATAPFVFIAWLTWLLLQPMVERWPTLPMF